MAESQLPRAVLARVTQVWRELLGASDDGSSVEFVTRDDLDSVVSVRIGDTCLVAGPGRALVGLRSLAPAQLEDSEAVSRVLGSDARPVGTADLAYATHPDERPACSARPATDDDEHSISSRVSPEDWDESGLGGMTRRWGVTHEGACVAMAGFEVWRDVVAHLGVVTVPELRGAGLGRAVAAAARDVAISDGLIPQWRSSVDNPASRRLGERLGFIVAGRQSAVVVGG